MRFTWTEDQTGMRETLRKFVADRFRFENRGQRIRSGIDPGAWSELAELGVLALPFEERFGGGGGTALDTMLIMETFGRFLVVEPFVPTVILAGGLLRHAGTEEQKSRLIPAIVSGQTRLAFAYAEPQSRFNMANIATQARPRDGGFVISGHKAVVYGAPECHMLIVSARTAGARSDAQGISLFLVPLDTAGLTTRAYRCVDGMAAAEVTLNEVWVSADGLVGTMDQALPAIERVVDEAIAAVCGEAVGAMSALIEKCVEYAKTRQAFGKPIAQFQAISHRLVDMTVSHEIAAASALKAASKLAAGAGDSARATSAAKAQVGREAAFVGKAAVQLHGAIGTTHELDVGHYFKRLMAIQTMFGSADFHLRRYIQLDTDTPKAADGY